MTHNTREGIKKAIEQVLLNRIKHIGDEDQLYTGYPAQLIEELANTLHQELQKAQIEALWEAVDLADKIESREPDGGTKQWMAFKAFRNTLRDRIKDQSELDQPNN